jgi:hypothetical protein
MNRYEVNYFSGVDWRHITLEVLAESEEQVRSYVDNLRLPEYRDKPYKYKDHKYEDTLKIKIWEEGISLPYVLREY